MVPQLDLEMRGGWGGARQSSPKKNSRSGVIRTLDPLVPNEGKGVSRGNRGFPTTTKTKLNQPIIRHRLSLPFPVIFYTVTT